MSFTDRVANYFRYPKRVREAAQQMWEAVMRGYVFEVPLSLDKHDPAMNAVFLLQKMHPEVRLGVRQSRSVIVSHESRHNISADTKQLLLKGGQMYNPEEFTSSIERMLGGHEAFLREQSLDPKEMEREAKEAEAKLHAIEVKGDGKGLETTETLTVTKVGPDGEQTSPTRPVEASAPVASTTP